MEIDFETYKLDSKKYIEVESIKKNIVIGSTNNNNMRHVIGWNNRHNGSYNKTAHFTIDIYGKIYQHFNPQYQSNYFNDLELNCKTIIILLDNDGYLIKNDEKNCYNTWVGDIYSDEDNIIEKKWREYKYWVKYTDEQFNSAVDLVKYLCKDFFIPNKIFEHNIKIDNLSDYEGVLYKSNIEKYYHELTPAWDFKKFKLKIENDE
jgi:hypothetical protein